MAKQVVATRQRSMATRGSRARDALAGAAGPLLILGSVLFGLRGFVFANLLSSQHPDLLSFVLPRLSFLGRSLAQGHVPLWNPFDMAGMPYAADPQSGWLYLPPMMLFSLLSPASAMRAFVVLNPALAGLGAYWFLRLEGVRRVAATAGGLSLSMTMATSIIAISMPFAGAIAWTTILLVAASGYSRADRWSRRTAWLMVGAFAWGQVAAAHMSHGLGIATLLVIAYLAAAVARDARAGRASPRAASIRAILFLAVLALANVAIIAPRIALVERSSLRAGYDAVAAAPGAHRAIVPNGVWPAWPLALGSTPGAYAGAAILLGIPAAIRARSHRGLTLALGFTTALAYAATWPVLIEASWFRNLVLRIPFGDIYLHNPGRLRYLWLLCAPLLGAVGIDGFIERPLPWRRALGWMGAGLALFLLLPLALGAHPVRFSVLAIGAVGAVPALCALAGGRRAAPILVPGLLALELVGSAAYSQAYEGGTVFLGLEEGEHPNLVHQPLRWPDVPADEYLRPGPIARVLAGRQERYLTWALPDATFVKGYLWSQDTRDWPALANGRATLFGAHDVLGYNPIQLRRYWSYIRETNDSPVYYNASVLSAPSPEDIGLLGVGYVIVSRGFEAPVPARPLQTEGDYELYEVIGAPPRASVVGSWRVVGDPAAALDAVLEPGFDTGKKAVLERASGVAAGAAGSSGTAEYLETSPEDVRISLRADGPSILVVRNSWDEGWSATVDGRSAPVLLADYMLQGVPVPAGRHEVRIVYRDPWITRGLLGSSAAWAALIVMWVASVLLRRRS